jgi:hypothetical protein
MSDDDNIMNIQLNKVTGKCDEKCMLKYNYNTSSTCVATNNTNYFSLTYDKNSKNPVTFNNNEYNVTSIFLYFHSVHYFNGDFTAGEIVILHKCSANGKLLFICLPLSDRSGSPSNLLSNILNRIVTIHITSGYSNDLKLDVDYNLNNILKYEPFYYYYDKNNSDYICYGMVNAIYVSSDLIDSIKSLISVPSETMWIPKVSYLFYNKKGPVKYEEDEIYIDCKPVNSSGSEDIMFDNTGESNTNNSSSSISTKAPKNMALLEIIGIFLFIIMLFVVGLSFYRKMKSNSSTISTATATAKNILSSASPGEKLVFEIVDHLESRFKSKSREISSVKPP